jgi:DNA-binding NarL/FixJ family response regulator
MTVRVLVVDDHPMYCAGLTAALSSAPDIEVVGSATDGHEAVVAVDADPPDVVLMDLHMPGRNGVEATRRITSRHAGTAVVALTMLEGDDSVFSMLRAGACGYLLKGARREEIVAAVTAAARGEVAFSPAIAGRVLSFFSSGGDRGPAPFADLTEREREVLDLIARGLTNPAIAQRLFLSEKTVRNHVSNIFAKLHVSGRAEAVARARDAGLGEGPV